MGEIVKSEQVCKIIRGPHLLHTGGNAVKCYGIEVEAINPVPKGYCQTWKINAHVMKSAPNNAARLGITQEELDKINQELDALVAANIR